MSNRPDIRIVQLIVHLCFSRHISHLCVMKHTLLRRESTSTANAGTVRQSSATLLLRTQVSNTILRPCACRLRNPRFKPWRLHRGHLPQGVGIKDRPDVAPQSASTIRLRIPGRTAPVQRHHPTYGLGERQNQAAWRPSLPHPVLLAVRRSSFICSTFISRMTSLINAMSAV